MKKITPTDFYTRLQKLANEAVNRRGFLTVVLLAYKLDNPAFIKAVADKDYWRALDESSGNKIAFFYLDSTQHTTKQVSTVLQSTSKKRYGKMIPVEYNTEQSPECYVAQLLDKLGYGKYDMPQYPFVLFLRVNPDGNITDNFTVELTYKGGDETKAYEELQELIDKVIKSIQHVDRTGEMDRDTIWNLVKQGAKPGAWDIVVKIAELGLALRKLLS
ncbi:MAG: hypothetical protein LBB84_11820 [Tannerellaceae bacterium]|jgi:hypothetical protein|nr:hypothetical protein [Tannerellaceae bacterium]